MYRQSRNTLAATTVLFTGTILFLVTASLSASSQTKASAKPKAVLVELFTSEGCSSCPPADALLREINGSHAGDGQIVIGISEHVTYWNQLGWADPYSSPTYTDRQNAYSTRFDLDSVYTPQMIVNGTDQFVGSDRARLQQVLRHQQERPGMVAIQILSTNIEGRLLTLHFSAKPEDFSKTVDLFAVIADDSDQSRVSHGENSGRVLSHVFVARSFTRFANLKPTANRTIQLPLPGSFVSTQPHHLVLFAQESGNRSVLGVDTKPF